MAKISGKAYEELRLILEKQYERAFTIEEVIEIGNGLIDFFQTLREIAGIDSQD